MIEIESLAGKLQTALNINSLGLTFNINTDTGKYKRDKRNLNNRINYVCGLMSVISSDVSATQTGIKVATLTTRTEIIVKCKDFEEDTIKTEIADDGTQTTKILAIGNETFMSDIRAFLDGICTTPIFEEMTDKDGKVYNVSTVYSFTITGLRDQIPPIGDSMTFVITAYHNIVESGENSRSYIVFLDNQQIPYNNLTINRPVIMEQDVYSDTENGEALATITSNVLKVTVSCPSIISRFSDAIKNYLLFGERNRVHFLELVLGKNSLGETVKKTYLVNIIESPTASQGVTNVGFDLTFVETIKDYDLISFPATYKVYQYTGNLTEITINFNLSQGEKDVPIYISTGKVFNSGASKNITVEHNCFIVCTKEISNAQEVNLVLVG